MHHLVAPCEQGTAIAKRTKVVSTRVRDLTSTLVVLAVLFGMLMLINPRVRERAGQISGDVQNQQWDSPAGPVGDVATTVLAMTGSYAADNPFLFSFLVVAGVLFVLMLRT